MCWKSIRKMNWDKTYHHIGGAKYKALKISMVYMGLDNFDVDIRRDRQIDFAGLRLAVTILGLEISAHLYDYRRWNEQENRFCLTEGKLRSKTCPVWKKILKKLGPLRWKFQNLLMKRLHCIAWHGMILPMEQRAGVFLKLRRIYNGKG
ncbi:hypothetical protein [Candidatus Avelusimicrobium luingense]|uniref:hypothetical protein n=1 Tax=Candidatus Avelusimicrobium luingense TaxID=3416211 RepID=UPI003D144CE7